MPSIIKSIKSHQAGSLNSCVHVLQHNCEVWYSCKRVLVLWINIGEIMKAVSNITAEVMPKSIFCTQTEKDSNVAFTTRSVFLLFEEALVWLDCVPYNDYRRGQ